MLALRKKLSIKKLENLNLDISKAIISPYNLEFGKDKESSFSCIQLVSFIQSQKVTKDLSFVESLNIVIVKFALQKNGGSISKFRFFFIQNPIEIY